MYNGSAAPLFYFKGENMRLNMCGEMVSEFYVIHVDSLDSCIHTCVHCHLHVLLCSQTQLLQTWVTANTQLQHTSSYAEFERRVSRTKSLG